MENKICLDLCLDTKEVNYIKCAFLDSTVYEVCDSGRYFVENDCIDKCIDSTAILKKKCTYFTTEGKE